MFYKYAAPAALGIAVKLAEVRFTDGAGRVESAVQWDAILLLGRNKAGMMDDSCFQPTCKFAPRH